MFQLLAAYSAAAASSSYLIFIIFIFLGSTNNILFHFSTSTASTQLNCYDYAAGHNGVRCEYGAVMEYPFWRIDQQQHYCGYPGLGIACSPNGKPPIITISNQSFYLIGDDTDRRRLTIVDPDFLETTCPRPRRNFTFNHDLSDSTIERFSDWELNFFLNCTSPPPPLPPSQTRTNRSHHLECLDYNYNDTMMMRSYGFFSRELDYSDKVYIQLLADWNGNYCKENAVAQVSSSRSDGIIGYMQILQRGFGVMWSTPIKCQRCESSGGFCSFKYGNPITYNCWCKDERQLRQGADGREYCFNYAALHNKLRNKILIGVFTGVGGLLFITLLFIYCKNQRKRKRSIAKNVELFLESYGCRSSQRYKYRDIKKMTNSFKDKLGGGGFGSVFKGNT